MIRIRKGERFDAPEVYNLIKELADYEKSLDKVLISLQDLERDGFNKNPLFWTILAESKSEIVGMAFYYIRYSTWNGKILYLEDFFVKKSFRNQGIGTMLFEECIRATKKIDANGLAWQVLNWNQPAINFYKKYNAELKSNWMNGKLYKDQIKDLNI